MPSPKRKTATKPNPKEIDVHEGEEGEGTTKHPKKEIEEPKTVPETNENKTESDDTSDSAIFVTICFMALLFVIGITFFA